MLHLHTNLGKAFGVLLSSTLVLQPIAFAANISQSSNRPQLSNQELIAQQGEMAIFVSPNGADASGAGTQAQPFRTISAALSIAQPGSVIRLAPGTYSAQTGEVFPLKLQPGIQIRGESDKGQGTLISGGGRFVSPTFASQNIAMLAAHNTYISGVTISNPSPRGYGLWVESSKNVAIANNTFASSTHDGIFLTGSAIASITDNFFTKNRGSGVSAVGSSSGEIRGNNFDNTGFGLSIGQKSTVVLSGNQIVNNVDGVVISNTATPTLRRNTIANNSRNGLVVLKDRDSQPTPDLGTQQSPGQNVFRANKQKDIVNASGVPLIASGNEVNLSRVAGKLDTSVASYTPPVRAAQTIPPFSPPVSQRSTPPKSAASSVVSLPPTATPPTQNSTQNLPVVIASPVETISSNSSSRSQSPSSVGSVIIERELPPVATKLPSNSGNQSVNQPERRSNNSQPVALPPPSKFPASPSPSKSTPASTSVSRSIPIITESSKPGSVSKSASTEALRYRVIVPVSTQVNTKEVRRVAPDAFTSKYRGKPVVQVGAFSDRNVADAKAKLLADSGYKAIVVDFKY
jgi:parallel beta-helix repeat protein